MKPKSGRIISLSALLLFIWILSTLLLPGLALCSVDDFLCEVGLKFYKKGNYEEASHEFKKALLYNPRNPFAAKYIERMVQKQEAEKRIQEGVKSQNLQTPPEEPAPAAISQPKQESKPKLNYGFITRTEQKPQKECNKKPEAASQETNLGEKSVPLDLRENDRDRRRKRNRQIEISRELDRLTLPTGISHQETTPPTEKIPHQEPPSPVPTAPAQ